MAAGGFLLWGCRVSCSWLILSFYFFNPFLMRLNLRNGLIRCPFENLHSQLPFVYILCHAEYPHLLLICQRRRWKRKREGEREKLVAAFVLMRCSCAAYPTAMALNQLPSNSGSWLNFQKLRGEILKRWLAARRPVSANR